MEKTKMTRAAAIELLQNKKVYVNGKSAEIQRKLFELGWKWTVMGDTKITCLNSPFLYIDRDFTFSHGSNMQNFTDDNRKEISYKEILAIELIEELKENDIVVSGWNGKVEYCKWIAVVKRGNTMFYDYKVALSLGGTGLNNFRLKHDGYANTQEWTVKAKDEEKQILIDALKNSDIEDSKNILKEVFGIDECPFKPFDKVLVKVNEKEDWRPDFFARYIGYPNDFQYECIRCGCVRQCIKYEENKHLLNTFKSPEE